MYDFVESLLWTFGPGQDRNTVFGLAILLPLFIMLVPNLARALRSAVLLTWKEEEEAIRQVLEDMINRPSTLQIGKGK